MATLDVLHDYLLTGTSRLKDNIDWFSKLRQECLPELTENEITALSSAVKTRLQWEANQAHKAANRWGMICMATGTGKSKTAIDAVRGLLAFKPDAKILVVVPTVRLRDKGWKSEFEMWGMAEFWGKNVRAECYKSLPKMRGDHWDLVILDEVHNITQSQAAFFDCNFVASCMALTATKPEKEEKQLLLRDLKLNLLYEITLDEAVDLGVVAPYEITIIEVDLDNKRKYVQAGSKAKPFYQTEARNYQYYRNVEESEDPNVRRRIGKQFYINRMRFIYELLSKTETAQHLLKTSVPEELRTMIFCGSIDQATILCPYRFHSKTKEVDLELFNEGEIDRLSCVESLNEGHNIKNVDCAFVVQLNSNSLDLIQRIGRIIRFRYGHVGKIIILCAKDTVDAKWARSATAGLDPNKIKWVSYADLLEGKVVLNF